MMAPVGRYGIKKNKYHDLPKIIQLTQGSN
jgi:hypothetical protein